MPLAVEVELRAAAVAGHVAEAIAAESFQGARPTLRRGDPEAAWADCAHVFEGEFEFAGQEHFYLETNAALASDRRERAGVRPVVARSTRARRRRSSRTSWA